MIKAAYHYKSSPLKGAEFETSKNGLLLFDGVGAQALFDLLALKGEDILDGFCSVDDEDLLDLNNANRDRLPVSVISSSNYSFSVFRSQIPFGASADTSEVDAVCKKFMEKEHIPSAWSINFLHLFDAIFNELCARPKYVLLHLGGADKDFANAVVAFLYKAFRNFPIFVYAHGLTMEMHEEIKLYEDIDALLHPETMTTYFDEEKAEKDLTQTAFLNDLLGTGKIDFDPDGDDWDESFFEGGRNSAKEKWMMVAGVALEALAYIPMLFFFVYYKTDFILFFGSMLIYIVLTTASGFFGTRLYKEKKRSKFWKNKGLAGYCFSVMSLFVIAAMAMIYAGIDWGFGHLLYAYIVAYSLMTLHGFVLFFYYLFEYRIFFKGERKNPGQ